MMCKIYIIELQKRGKRMTKFVLFNSIKGGVGKSTLAAQTAVFLADFGRVSVMDCDPQQNLNRWLMRRNEAGETFQKRISPLPTDLDFSSKKLNQFDFVVIDSAGVDSKTGRKALLNADYLISPLKPSQADLDTILDHDDIIRQAKTINKKMHAFYLLNMCSTHHKDSEKNDTLTELKAADLASVVLDEVVFERKILRTSFSEGGSCFELKNNKSAKEIGTILTKILGV